MGKPLYTFEVTIVEGHMTEDFVRQTPVVSRTIEIRADQTLNQLHRAIFEAFDRWDDCHLHEFQFGNGPRDRTGARYVLPFIFDDPYEFDEEPATGSVTRTRIGGLELRVGQAFWYWYDFGDNWRHKIDVLAIGEVEPKVKYPRVVARVGESAPQYPPMDEEGWEDGDE